MIFLSSPLLAFARRVVLDRWVLGWHGPAREVLTKENGLDLGPCPNQLRRDFFEAYRDDESMQKVDAFVCQYAAAMCELFMPFNRPLIVIAPTRRDECSHQDCI